MYSALTPLLCLVSGIQGRRKRATLRSTSTACEADAARRHQSPRRPECRMQRRLRRRDDEPRTRTGTPAAALVAREEFALPGVQGSRAGGTPGVPPLPPPIPRPRVHLSSVFPFGICISKYTIHVCVRVPTFVVRCVLLKYQFFAFRVM